MIKKFGILIGLIYILYCLNIAIFKQNSLILKLGMHINKLNFNGYLNIYQPNQSEETINILINKTKLKEVVKSKNDYKPIKITSTTKKYSPNLLIDIIENMVRNKSKTDNKTQLFTKYPLITKNHSSNILINVTEKRISSKSKNVDYTPNYKYMVNNNIVQYSLYIIIDREEINNLTYTIVALILYNYKC